MQGLSITLNYRIRSQMYFGSFYINSATMQYSFKKPLDVHESIYVIVIFNANKNIFEIK
jgi:hypothetical protein